MSAEDVRVEYDLTGKVFGDLEVLSFAGRTANGDSQWLCRCLCGVEKVILGSNLTRRKIRSCGCYKRDAARQKMIDHLKG